MIKEKFLAKIYDTMMFIKDHTLYFSKLSKMIGVQSWFQNKGISQYETVLTMEKATDDHNTTIDEDDNVSINSDEDHRSWLSEHPSALGSFEEMMKVAQGKLIVVFLDYDGTLSPIVNDPQRAFMSNEMRCAVREVCSRFPTAIISGRSRNKVYEFVKLKEVYYAGSHGLDIIGPPPTHTHTSSSSSYDCKYQDIILNNKGEEFVIFRPAKEFLPVLRQMLKELKERTRDIEGAEVEDNTFCISVHYRKVKNEQDYKELEKRVEKIKNKYDRPGFKMRNGKMVLEIKPAIDWNKGHALKYFLDSFGFGSDPEHIIPIYIGDDRTDEDAFEVLRNRRGLGLPIIVTLNPRDTAATYSLRDPSEVLLFLRRLTKWT